MVGLGAEQKDNFRSKIEKEVNGSKSFQGLETGRKEKEVAAGVAVISYWLLEFWGSRNGKLIPTIGKRRMDR